MDKALASPELPDLDVLKSLIGKQLQPPSLVCNTGSFSRVVVNPDAVMEEDKTPELEATVVKDGGLEAIGDEVSDTLMENPPAPIKCPPCNYKSWDELESRRDGESRDVIPELETDVTGYEKKGRKRRKRWYFASGFGFPMD